jgi:N-acetylglucosaminyl-diphospho-decaprenol L-rhamnosyltransferase
LGSDSARETNATATFVIVHCRGYTDLSACLESIESYEAPRERPCDVIVIDHRSSAERLAPIAQRFAWARFIAEPGNPGFAAAVNRGVRACTTPYVIVLNPDCVLSGPVRESLASYLEATPDVGVVGPRLLNEDGRLQPSGRRFPDLTTALGGRRSWLTATAPGNWFSRRNLLLSAQDTAPKRVDWVSGACMMIRREAFDRVGGMDERFFLYWEDADFCQRLAKAGWRTMWHPGPEVTHFGAGSSRFAPYASMIAFHHSAYRYYRKHAGPIGRCGAPLIALLLGVRLLSALAFARLRAAWRPRQASAPPRTSHVS